MSARTYGEKYDKNLSTTQIAALVRAEIKAAVKAKGLPGGKYSVRSHSYSGGSSIHVQISGLGPDAYNPEYLEQGSKYLNGPSVEDETGWHRPSQFKVHVLKAVKKETPPAEAARVVAMVEEVMATVLPFTAPVKVAEEPEQVRFMREAGLI